MFLKFKCIEVLFKSAHVRSQKVLTESFSLTILLIRVDRNKAEVLGLRELVLFQLFLHAFIINIKFKKTFHSATSMTPS